MKKFVIAIFSTILMIGMCFGFIGCNTTKLSIENYEWKMRTVMNNDVEYAGSDEFVLAVGEEDELYPNAKIVDLILIAKDGQLTLIDVTNNKTYEGIYTIENRTPKEINYKVVIDGKEGYATVAMTEYYGGSEEPTLPINLGDYSIYFYAK